MKILITGSTGLLGQALIRRFSPRDDVTGVSRQVPRAAPAYQHIACDLTDAEAAKHAVTSAAPAVVIHTQALSDVYRCEREPDEAHRQNVETTEHLVRALRGQPTLLVHISTDYVFDGVKAAPYTERDDARPLSVYGRSKLAAEAAAQRHRRSVVIRPSTLFGPGRMNFCDHVAEALMTGGTAEAFSDQVTSPTYTEDVAAGIAALLDRLTGPSAPAGYPMLYHLANDGACRRVDLAWRIADLVGRSREGIRPVRMAEQRRAAPRPAYSALDSRAIAEQIGWRLRPWDDALQGYLRQRRWLG